MSVVNRTRDSMRTTRSGGSNALLMPLSGISKSVSLFKEHFALELSSGRVMICRARGSRSSAVQIGLRSLLLVVISA